MNRFVRLIALLAAVSFGHVLSFSSVVSAEASSAVHVVNVQQLVEKSVLGQRAKNEIQSRAKKAQASLTVLSEEIKRMESELIKSKDMLSDDVKKRRAEDIREKQKTARRKAEDLKDEIALVEREELAEVLKKIRAVVIEVADEQNYPLIIEDDPRIVAYYSKKIDITEQVLKALDQRAVGL